MCGLVGMAGFIGDKQEKAFKSLLVLDSLRGTDGTGAAIILQDGETDLIKTPGHCYDLIDYTPFNRRLTQNNKLALLGHNRAATIGGITRNNAHPFQYGDIVGAHNGTLHNKNDLHGHAYHAVDSQSLYSYMNEHGPKNTIPKLRGAWALTWVNTADKTINFIRNKERPLILAFSKFGNTLYWASEEWMLLIACRRNDIDIEAPFSLEEDTLHTFAYEKFKIELKAKEQLKGATFFQNQPNHWQQPGGIGTGSSTTTEITSPSVSKKGSVVQFPPPLSAKTGWEAGLAGTKQLKLECLRLSQDSFGAEHIICSSEDHPYSEFRLYINRARDKDPERYVGREILADVNKYHQIVGTGKGYYKLEYSTHRFAKKEEEQQLYKDANGMVISKEKWLQHYGSCCWCNSNIGPNDVFHFSNSGREAVCETCASDPEVCDYVRM